MNAPLARGSLLLTSLLGLGAGCTVDGYAILEGDVSEDTGESSTTGADTDPGEDESDEGSNPGGLLDLPEDELPMQAGVCIVAPDQVDGALPCELEPPSEVIAPVTAWTWTGPGGEDSVLVTPLVANLDDDNDDGFVDLCDHPDIVVAAVDLPPGKTDVWPAGHLHVIDGASGATSRVIPTPIDAAVNPALGDLDGDGVPEIVALQAQGPNSPHNISERRLMAFRANGELLWAGQHWSASRGGGALAIADLDNDGSPEILAPEYVASASGELLWAPSNPARAYSMPIAVDLDLDGDLEVMFGGTAYEHDGVKLFDTPTVPQDRGSVAVANFDDDEFPEFYVQYGGDHAIFEHDGAFKTLCPTGTAEIAGAGGYPVAIHDLDGDDQAELLFGYEDRFYVLTVEADSCFVKWSKKTDALNGLSSGTLFDLLGDGHAEAIYADRSHIRLYSSTGELLFQADHSARESIANPIIADVDGDGAAEILVVSSEPVAGDDPIDANPTLVLLENADDRFVPTRRIWNQHTYHQSNVTEDGRIPAFETPHWKSDNGFRANRRAYPSDQCIPTPLESSGP
ncbi:FG-GAP repeat protein [Enhygromyxa salina]|uniref:FG-GAP repeat protein n=1 Tax=Enhygromyxa salina TaxID=215803 RepID=A0A2S9XX94_9BACT|nr:VCBS repeat-containing protein [Enhygromyxa salina]PRP97485.1 FG-GAP repeat protein [Enhygromyxa salina]